MENFIHTLATPACVIFYTGEIIDINKWMISDLRASSKLQFVDCSILDLMVDRSKFKLIQDRVQLGNIIQNLKVLLKTFDNKILERTINVTLFLDEKDRFLFQSYGAFEHQNSIVDRSESILREVERLYPHLSNKGKKVWEQVSEMNHKLIDESVQKAKFEFISKRISSILPELTPTELHLCSLVFMGFSSHEISAISGLTPNAIRVNIYRLCRKYNVASRDELFLLLKSALEFELPNASAGFYI